MAIVKHINKGVSINPLKMSQPLGASLAYLGIKNCMPLMHGSQGCTSFAKVLMVRHFREAIPLQTTAMSEVSTILGGDENIISAILKIYERSKPDIIGLCSTGLTETKGDDIEGALRTFYKEHSEFAPLPVVYASTPDYKGSMEDGYKAAVMAILRTLCVEKKETDPNLVTILASHALTPADIEYLKELIESFGLRAIVLPDLSTSLDGHLEQDYSPLSAGGTTLDEIRDIPNSAAVIAIGESMREGAEYLSSQFGIAYTVFGRLNALKPVDRFMMLLSNISGNPVPDKYRRDRKQLQDAMLDAHFFFSGKKVAIALEPDLLFAVSKFVADMGAKVTVAVTSTESAMLGKVPADEVLIGDLGDFEEAAVSSDILITNSHGARISKRLDVPLYRMGIPIFDRLGNAHKLSVGYKGSANLLFDIGNVFIDNIHDVLPHSLESGNPGSRLHTNTNTEVTI